MPVSKTKKLLALIFLVATISGRAASAPAALFQHRGAARPTATPSSKPIPHSVNFRDVPGRGLLVRTWVNGAGPFNFAIDTGAGATLLSPRVAEAAHVRRDNGRASPVGGLSGATRMAYHALIETFAIGDPDNQLVGSREVMITSGLPNDLDGVFDPTDALSPLGYTIDIPRREFVPFDPSVEPVRKNQTFGEGTVVAWLREGQGRRPFVMLDNGNRALLDTGSSLGLAVPDRNADPRKPARVARDVGGGQVSTRRGSTSISIGSLTLQRIPTDFISGSDPDTPVLLGLAALRPFRLRFDPVHRLIEISADSSSPRN